MKIINRRILNSLTRLTGIWSLLLNLIPFLLYFSLIDQRKPLLVTAFPFAIYYASRHSGLLLFRDLRYDYQRLAWIGILNGIIGYGLGIFGSIIPILYDLSGVCVGIASSLFPIAVNQRKRLIKYKLLPPEKTVKPIIQLLLVLGFLGLIFWIKNISICFGLMFIVSLCAAGAYYNLPRSVHPLPVHLNLFNYLLAFILLGSMMLLRLGRSIGIEQPFEWGLILLITFFFAVTLSVVHNRQSFLCYPNNLRQWIMLYGVCGQYWTLYSTIFIGIVYGMNYYYWVIIAYLLAYIFGSLLVKKLNRRNSSSMNLIMIIIGIILTLWLSTYFIGIFIIRSFTGVIRKNTLADYERATHNYTISYIVNNYYSSFTGLISQLVMWGSLLIVVTPRKINEVLGAVSSYRIDSANQNLIMIVHIILAGYMILYVIWLLLKQRKSK